MGALLRASAGDFARVFSIPALVLCLAFAVAWWFRRSRRPLPPHAIDSSNYRVPPTHRVHVVDFDRSRVTICEDKSVIAGCCMQGCDVSVKIGRDIIGLVVAEELAEQRTDEEPGRGRL